MTVCAGDEPIIGLILAGGLGRRMGGRDKGLALLDGTPLVKRVLARFAPQVRKVLVSANRNPADYAALGIQVVPDRLPGFIGPLAGLDAAFAAASQDSEWLATCPCDAPFLPPDLVARLWAAVRASGASIAMARTGNQNHPVFLLAHNCTAPTLADFLAAGNRRVLSWVQSQDHIIVPFDDCPECFVNFNADIAQAEAPPRGS